MAKSVKVEWWLLKKSPAKHNTNKFSISDEAYTKFGNYINKHLRFKRKFMKQRANTYILRHRVCFQMQFRTVLINYFRLTYSRGSFTVKSHESGDNCRCNRAFELGSLSCIIGSSLSLDSVFVRSCVFPGLFFMPLSHASCIMSL